MLLPRRSVTASPAAAVEVPSALAPAVSFVIVTYGTGQIVIDTIRSVVDAAAEDGIPIEVIVVDNPHPNHPGRSRTELQAYSAGVRIVAPSTNSGFGGGCELGALCASAPTLVFLNPDVTVVAGWLPPLIDLLTGDEAPAIVAPVLVNPDGSVQEMGQTIDRKGETTPNLVAAGEQQMIVDYASAACWVMRRDEHERVGGFDPAYHPAYFEDVDLSVRTRALGGACAVHTGVRVVHHHGSGTPERSAPAFAQRDQLLATWPSLRWTGAPTD